MNIHFIIIEPYLPENVASAARAMKTMGFKSMRLVNPCDYLSDLARWLAYGSNEILENANTYNSFKEAISDLDFVIGTSAKKRSVKHDYYELSQLKLKSPVTKNITEDSFKLLKT